ncbi:MAG: hypothetical protein VYD66_06700, partial [Candidatus Neomarinimicrobiota bacterium]|nr:hypothetical protein [Candidatus Neomarinimicrobiota bacterium]
MILLRVAVWGDFIQKKLNEKITSTGWSIDVGSSFGTLFGTMHLQNISLSHQDGSQILIKKSSINFGHIASFFGEITFDILSIEGLSTEFSKTWTKMDSSKVGTQSINIPFHVKSFFVSGQIMSAFNEQFDKINLKIGGEFEGGTRPILVCDLFQLSIEENPNMLANLRSLVLGFDGSSFYLNKVTGDILGVPTRGEMIFDDKRSLLTGNINISEIKIPEELFTKLPLQNKFSTFSGSFDFESDLKYFSGTLVLENDLGLDMMGE